MKQDNWRKFVFVLIVIWGGWILVDILNMFDKSFIIFLIILTIIIFIIKDLIKTK